MYVKCAGIGCVKKGNFKKCSSCKLIYYCSKTCQKASWPSHKRECRYQGNGNKKILCADGVKRFRFTMTTDKDCVGLQMLDQVPRVCTKYNIDDPKALLDWMDETAVCTSSKPPILKCFQALCNMKQIGLFVDLLEIFDVDMQSPKYSAHPRLAECTLFGNSVFNRITKASYKIFTSDAQKICLLRALYARGIGEWARGQH